MAEVILVVFWLINKLDMHVPVSKNLFAEYIVINRYFLYETFFCDGETTLICI